MKSCPYVDNICVCGGTYSNELTALVSPNHKNLLKLAQDMGLKGAQIPDLCNNSEVNKRVYESIVKTGQSSNINKKGWNGIKQASCLIKSIDSLQKYRITISLVG